MPKQTFFNLEDSKQNIIIQAGIEEFASKPFSKVTVDNLVDNAGIPKGSFYQYFTNKEDLYKHIFIVLSQKKKDVLSHSISDIGEKGFSDFIRELYLAGMNFDLEKTTYLDLNEQFLHNCTKELRDGILEVMIEESNALFNQVLSYYVKKGDLKADLKIEMLSSMMTSLTIFMSKSLMNESKLTRNMIIERIDGMLSVIENGILRR